MTLENFFKQIVLMHIIVLFAILFHAVMQEPANERIFMFSLAIVVGTIFGIPLFLLYMFKPLGRKLYVIITILCFLMLLPVGFIDPEALSISSAVEYILDALSNLLTGAILVMLYCTDISHRFARKPKKS